MVKEKRYSSLEHNTKEYYWKNKTSLSFPISCISYLTNFKINLATECYLKLPFKYKCKPRNISISQFFFLALWRESWLRKKAVSYKLLVLYIFFKRRILKYWSSLVLDKMPNIENSIKKQLHYQNLSFLYDPCPCL